MDLPSHWKRCRLGELCEPDAPIMYGILQPGPEIPGGIPYVRPTEIDDNGIALERIKRTTVGISERYRRSTLRSGDLLITIVGTLGKIALVPPELDGANITQSSARIRVDSRKACPGYIRQLLRSPVAVRQYERHKLGTGVPRLNIHHVRDLDIPLPPLSEQRRIAEVLDRAEALRATRRAALAELDTLTQAIFLEMFGDPVRNPKGWDKVPLGEVVKVAGGYAFKSDDFQAEGCPVIRISNLVENGIDFGSIARVPQERLGKGVAFRVLPGDILIAMSGATTGKLGIVPQELNEPVYQNQRVGNFKILEQGRISREYLLAILKSDFYQKFLWQLAAGVAQPNVSGQQLESAIVPLPPLQVQQLFATRVALVAQLTNTSRLSADQCDELFASLQDMAFKGEL